MLIRHVILLSLLGTVIVGCRSDRPYPDQAVIEYVNLDSAEIQRQRAFEARGMQVIAPVVLPEGDLGKKSEQHGLPYHFGWPHAVMIDENIILHIKDLFLIRSTDRGQTWEDPLFVDGAPILAMVATQTGKVIAVSVDRDKESLRQRARTMQVLISEDKGGSWRRHTAHVDMPIGLQGLTSRIVEHPKFGLITGAHYNVRKDTLTFLVSGDEGETWRSASFPTDIPMHNHGSVVFMDGDGKLGAFVRNHETVSDRYSKAWTSFSQFVPVNADRAERFEDLVWKGAQTNIWMRKDDSCGAQYNPVSGRIEAVTTKRDWGFPDIEAGYMTLNLWSIDPRALHNGSNYWRYEGTLLRSKGEKSRVNPRDGMHPAGTVIDEQQGVQHVFFYAGDRSHGGDGAPDTGKTGIFRLSRTLDTRAWVEVHRDLDNYKEIYGVNDAFNDLDGWQLTGSMTGVMALPEKEPPHRTPVPAPNGLVEVNSEGHLHIKTGEAGVYALHKDRVIATSNFRLAFRAKIEKFPRSGHALGVHVSVGAEKYDIILKEDGIYEWAGTDPERYTKVASTEVDNEWHTWVVTMQGGKSTILRDEQHIGNGLVRIDGTIGHRPITLSVASSNQSDTAEVLIDFLKFENLDFDDKVMFADRN